VKLTGAEVATLIHLLNPMIADCRSRGGELLPLAIRLEAIKTKLEAADETPSDLGAQDQPAV
jgi:hypothetical protein